MGRSSEPPFLYGRPDEYNMGPPSVFNPKAVTMASCQPPLSRRGGVAHSPADGPLISFNKHPDSYLISSYNRDNSLKPMARRTKACISWARRVQLGLRVLQLVSAIGLFICAICIRGTQDTEGWIMRVPVRGSHC